MRATISKTTERRRSAMSPAPRSHPGSAVVRLRRVSRCEVARSVSRKMRLATPVAATTSTEISPNVSHTRMSTRVTLTTLLPPPYS